MKPFAKIFLLFTVLTISLNCFNQKQSLDRKIQNYGELLLNKDWSSDHILGVDPSIEAVKLTVTNRGRIFSTIFYENSEYTSEIIDWCNIGNNVKVIGEYKLFDKNKIVILVKTAERDGITVNPTEYPLPQYLTYEISLIGGNVILTKQK